MSIRRKKTIIISLLALAIALPIGADIFANNASRLEAERQEIRDNRAELQAELAQARQEENAILEQMILNDIELLEVSQAHLAAIDDLERTRRALYYTEIDLAQVEADREVQFDILQGRLRFMHQNNNLSYLELLLSSQNLTDFLNNREHFRRIVEKDNATVTELLNLEEQILRNRNDIDAQRIALEIHTEELEIQESALLALLAEQEAALFALSADQDSLEALIRASEVAEQRIQNEIARAQAQANSIAAANNQMIRQGGNVRPSNGSLVWPVQRAPFVTSDYGNRPRPFGGGTEFHTGIDMQAPHGTPILAAADGVVTFSGWMGGGWGNVVMIDHGGGFTTFYSHNSANLVSVGTHVTTGQQIARAGATGLATGSHLHFEVRIDGRHTDPGPFLGIR
ncbi:MAG: peptidoglycan DD-metalloendopeptidase family protein [Defluviitaleaceae bacterium]|nr:peptidoglycan DD-metalloendopeptidase family protein [Defluviitaleaceae bacterium]